MWVGDAEEGRQCPVLLAMELKELMLGWQMLERGILPYGDGWLNQPYQWMQAMEIIDAQVTQAKREKQQRVGDFNQMEM